MSNWPKGNIIFVQCEKNHGTSSASFRSSIYSELEILLHFTWTQKLQLLRKTDLWWAAIFQWQIPQGLFGVVTIGWGCKWTENEYIISNTNGSRFDINTNVNFCSEFTKPNLRSVKWRFRFWSLPVSGSSVLNYYQTVNSKLCCFALLSSILVAGLSLLQELDHWRLQQTCSHVSNITVLSMSEFSLQSDFSFSGDSLVLMHTAESYHNPRLFFSMPLCDFFLLKAYIFDIRNSAYLHRLSGQSDVISCVNFCPQTPMVFTSFSRSTRSTVKFYQDYHQFICCASRICLG